MTSRERYTRMITGQPADILPRLPILMQFAAEHIGSNYGKFASDYRVLVESNMRCCEEFGIDQFNTMSDPFRETAALGAEIIFEPNAVPRCTAHPLEQDPDFRKLPTPDPAQSPRTADRIAAVKQYLQLDKGQHSTMGWVEGPAAEAADLRGVSNFFMDLIDDEAYVCQLMDFCVDYAIQFAIPQIAAGADTIGIGDAVCSQVSRDLYERLIWPREKRLVEELRRRGAFVRLHICGNITHLLPGIAGLGVNVVDIDHMVDLVEARRILGRDIVISGNINPVSGVMKSHPDQIRKAIVDCYHKAGNPFMVNAGCEIPPGTPVENLKALCEPVVWENR